MVSQIYHSNLVISAGEDFPRVGISILLSTADEGLAAVIVHPDLTVACALRGKGLISAPGVELAGADKVVGAVDTTPVLVLDVQESNLAILTLEVAALTAIGADAVVAVEELITLVVGVQLAGTFTLAEGVCNDLSVTIEDGRRDHVASGASNLKSTKSWALSLIRNTPPGLESGVHTDDLSLWALEVKSLAKKSRIEAVKALRAVSADNDLVITLTLISIEVAANIILWAFKVELTRANKGIRKGILVNASPALLLEVREKDLSIQASLDTAVKEVGVIIVLCTVESLCAFIVDPELSLAAAAGVGTILTVGLGASNPINLATRAFISIVAAGPGKFLPINNQVSTLERFAYLGIISLASE